VGKYRLEQPSKIKNPSSNLEDRKRGTTFNHKGNTAMETEKTSVSKGIVLDSPINIKWKVVVNKERNPTYYEVFRPKPRPSPNPNEPVAWYREDSGDEHRTTYDLYVMWPEEGLQLIGARLYDRQCELKIQRTHNQFNNK
jgi:hypothetical protein